MQFGYHESQPIVAKETVSCMSYTLDQVRALVAVAEELHFGRAAERLQMTQPPLSRQIQRLESQIGVQLLTRSNRRVELTDAGRAFLDEARRILAIADSAPQVARTVAAGLSGIVRIGFTASSAFTLLGPTLARLSAALPDVTIELQEMVTKRQLDALTKNTIDVSIGRPPFDPDQFSSLRVHREGLLIALPADHLLARRTSPITVEDLVNEDIIMHSPVEAKYFYDIATRLMPISRWRHRFTVSQVSTMVALVAARCGVALVPESAAAFGLPGVVYAPLMTSDPSPIELHAVWRADDSRPLTHRVVRELQDAAPSARRSGFGDPAATR